MGNTVTSAKRKIRRSVRRKSSRKSKRSSHTNSDYVFQDHVTTNQMEDEEVFNSSECRAPLASPETVKLPPSKSSDRRNNNNEDCDEDEGADNANDELPSTKSHSGGQKPNLKELSVSAQWRERGNDFYRDATGGLSPTVRISRLQEAINLYGRALSTAADDDERASACKNMAMANWKIAKAKMAGSASRSSTTFSFVDAMKHFQDAKECGKGRNFTWLDTLTVAALGCWSDARERAEEWSFEERVRALEKLVGYIIDDSTKAREYLDIATNYFHWAVTAIGERDYQQSLRLLGEVHFPLNEARRLWRADSSLQRECEVLEEDVYIQHCVAESIQARIRGEQLLNRALKDDEILNLDMVWEVVDWLRRAAQLTRERDLELEAMALSSLGKVYHKVLKMKERAKTCLMKALELANTMVPRTFTSEKWYVFARTTVEEYQQEKQNSEDEENKKKRDEIMKLIKEEVDVLTTKHKDLSKLEFLKFIYTTHPPKNPEHKLGEVSDNPEWKELKKYYQKAVIHYHPDKVQVDEHGAKWKVLTEEITKLLTSHYEFYKGCD